jgi:hypothetical protein
MQDLSTGIDQTIGFLRAKPHDPNRTFKFNKEFIGIRSPIYKELFQPDVVRRVTDVVTIIVPSVFLFFIFTEAESVKLLDNLSVVLVFPITVPFLVVPTKLDERKKLPAKS